MRERLDHNSQPPPSVDPAYLPAPEGGTAVMVKVVPGASRTRLVGRLGARLKVQVAAPPEGGKANKALCALLAEALGVPRQDVAVTGGATRPQKEVTVAGLDPHTVADRLKV